MKPFDDEMEENHEWRAVFYNAEDVAENGDFANFDTTAWQLAIGSTLEQKIEVANRYAQEHGFDTVEIEIKKEAIRTIRFNTEVISE